MPLTARQTDPTAHGTPLTGMGSPDVYVGKLPAWRATDFHTCPLATPGGTSHVGGQVPIGSPTVRINGLSAARQGDTIVESGPPNAIVGGCPTVLIG